MVLFYKANKFEGELKSSAEGDVFWVTLNELSEMDLSPDMGEMLKVFLDDTLSEFYYQLKNGEWVHELK